MKDRSRVPDENSIEFKIDANNTKTFLEHSRAFLFGGVVGLSSALLLYRIKCKVLIAAIASGLSTASLCHLRSQPEYDQYYKAWDQVKNDPVGLNAMRSSSDALTSDEFHYYYNKYLKFYYPQFDAEVTEALECKTCKD